MAELQNGTHALIDFQVLEQFQQTEHDSQQFNLRLIETTAVAIHEIAVIIHEHKNKSHGEDEIRSVTLWQTPPLVLDGPDYHEVVPYLPPHPTLFFHYQYLNHENFPAGLADAAGYWAEVCTHPWLPFLNRTCNLD